MFVRLLITIVLACSIAGCASGGARSPDQKELAKRQWNSARAAVLASLARSQYDAGNFDACAKSIDDALALDPRSAPLHVLRARLCIEQGKLDQADRALGAARTIDGKDPEIDYLAGVICQRWQRPLEAMQCYERASTKAPAELAYVLARAEMLVALDRRAEALAILREKLVYHENSAAIRDAVGQLLVQESKYADAAKVLKQASILTPDELGIREHLALALYYAADYAEAETVLERLLKNEKYATRADLQAAMGECLLQQGKAREARDSFESAAQLQGGSCAIWLGLAKAAIKLKDQGRAELSLRKALSLEPANSEANLMLGYVRLQQNRLDEALAAFKKAAANSRDPVSLCMCGYVLERMGKAGEAIDYYAQALKIKPDDDLAASLMSSVRLDE